MRDWEIFEAPPDGKQPAEKQEEPARIDDDGKNTSSVLPATTEELIGKLAYELNEARRELHEVKERVKTLEHRLAEAIFPGPSKSPGHHVSVPLKDYTLDAKVGLRRKWDEEKLKELYETDGPELGGIIKQTYRVDPGAFSAAPEPVQSVLSDAATVTCGPTSITITENKEGTA